jgi:hypothetical protein
LGPGFPFARPLWSKEKNTNPPTTTRRIHGQLATATTAMIRRMNFPMSLLLVARQNAVISDSGTDFIAFPDGVLRGVFQCLGLYSSGSSSQFPLG